MSEDDDSVARDEGPISRIQDALAELDPTAMLTGFVAVAEWAEADGSSTFSVISTPMTPWNKYGLLAAASGSPAGEPQVVFVDSSDFDDDDEEY